MNLFKVLASSKKSFPEEQASIILAWLLNPYMEHGLGSTFFNKFLFKLNNKNHNIALNEITNKLRNNINEGENTRFAIDIELNVDSGFIDIAFFINDTIFSIENKIYSKSAQDFDQLKNQYEGLKKKYSDNKQFNRIVMIFLVPDEETYEKNIDKVFNSLVNLHDNDEKIIIGWKNKISEIIREILEEESIGKIIPVNEYVRHTLKALLNFIKDDFEGYYYEKSQNYSVNLNPLTKGRISLKEIKTCSIKPKYIGVKYGISGLFVMNNIEEYKYQYTNENMEFAKNWLSTDTFLSIVNFICVPDNYNIDWIESANKLSYKIILKIANKLKNQEEIFYIGIKGGKRGLKNLSIEEIENKNWGVSLESNTEQWISDKIFLAIIENKLNN